MEFVDLNDVWKYRDIILSEVSLIDLMREYDMKLEEKGTGQFTHRAICPFHQSSNGGKETIPSLYASEETNTFYCFGPCEAQGTIFDFVSLMDGSPPMIAAIKLAKKIGIIDKDGKYDELRINSCGKELNAYDVKKTIEPYLFEISDMLRDYISKYVDKPNFESKLKKMENFSLKIDRAVSKLEYGDWERAEEILNKVKERMRRKN